MITAEAITNAKQLHKSPGIALTTYRYCRTRTIGGDSQALWLSAICRFAGIRSFITSPPLGSSTEHIFKSSLP